MTYDHWKTTEPEQDGDEFPQHFSQCDCCGEMKPDCEDIVYQGMDTHACFKCRGNAEDEDEAADRGDHEYHQGRDD
jgi:hypothetical protein